MFPKIIIIRMENTLRSFELFWWFFSYKFKRSLVIFRKISKYLVIYVCIHVHIFGLVI